MTETDLLCRPALIWDDDEGRLPIELPGGWKSFVTARLNPDTLAGAAPGAFSAILLLAELKWDGHRRDDLYGLEVLTKLRADHDARCPILVCSFLPRRELDGRSQLLRWSRHHPFLRLPFVPEEVDGALRNAEPVSDERMPHLLQLCDPIGRLERLLTHGTGFILLTRVPATAPAEQVWRGLEHDDILLRRYLQAAELSRAVAESGATVHAALQDALQARSDDALARLREATHPILAALRAARPL